MIQQFGEIIVLNRTSIGIFLVLKCSFIYWLMTIAFPRVFTILVYTVKPEQESSASELIWARNIFITEIFFRPEFQVTVLGKYFSIGVGGNLSSLTLDATPYVLHPLSPAGPVSQPSCPLSKTSMAVGLQHPVFSVWNPPHPPTPCPTLNDQISTHASNTHQKYGLIWDARPTALSLPRSLRFEQHA